MKRRIALFLLAACAAVVPPAAPQTQPRYLGFAPGEERRYVLGPPEELYSGEQAMWSIHLREVLADPPLAVFALTQVWDRGEQRRQYAIGTVIHVQSEGELRVNRHGFPVEARFETQRHLAGLGDEVYSARYRFENGSLSKHIAVGGRDLDHNARHLSNDGLDMDVPTGMYAFGTTALGCLLSLPPESMSQPTAMPGPPGAAGGAPPVGSGQAVRWARDVNCKEPLFANPGLLSLMLPALWEAGTGELDFVVLTPAGFMGMPGIGGGGALPGMSVLMQNRHFDSQAASHPRTNSDIEHLRYRDRVRVDVGARSSDAWLFDGMHDFDAVYVDDDGVVLRVDLAPQAALITPASGERAFDASGAGSRIDIRPLTIRLLYPSEY